MSVEIWDAIQFIRVQDKSRTKPLVLQCERRNASAGASVAPLALSVPSTPSALPLLGASGRPLGETPQLILPGQPENAPSQSEPPAESELPEPDVVARDFVVKALGHPEVLEETLFKELFGNLLAREFGIRTPEPALIVFTDAFVQSVQPQLPNDIKLRAGYAVGCEYLNPFFAIGSDFRFPLFDYLLAARDGANRLLLELEESLRSAD